MTAPPPMPPRPTALPVLFANIPAELKALDQWVCWRFEYVKDRWTKVPYMPCKSRASSTDPKTWSQFLVVELAYGMGGWDGIGIIHTDGIVGTDLDDCRDAETGELNTDGAAMARGLDTYTEVSPSAEGIRAFAFGRKPGPKCVCRPREMYDGRTQDGKPGGRFLTVTGHHLDGAPTTVNHRQAEIEALYRDWFETPQPSKNGPAGGKSTKSKPAKGTAPFTVNAPGGLSDDDIVRKAGESKNGAKFQSLWAGEIDGYPSGSEADLALCALLAFWTGPDAGRIDRLFRRSGLMDAKWERQDYRDRTIAKALEGQTEFYGKGGGPRVPPPGGRVAPGRQPAVEAIMADFRERYDPTFRRGNVLYAAKLGREVKAAEACFAASSDLISRLADLDDAPRDRGGKHLDPGALPAHFKKWAPTAWRDLLDGLPEEDATVEVVAPAQAEFVAALRRAFLTPFAVGYNRTAPTGGTHTPVETEVQRRPVIQWARQFALSGRWADVRGLQIWSKKGEGQRVRVAFRAELLSQIHARDLAGIGHHALANLCVLYGVGVSTKVRGGESRAVELSAEFLADLLDDGVPAEDEADTRTDDKASPAGAYAESASGCPGSEEKA